jgi:2-polyprenyl-6-methoxyphenol hydroxylase-like FAD-dependent oxidoreductase
MASQSLPKWESRRQIYKIIPSFLWRLTRETAFHPTGIKFDQENASQFSTQDSRYRIFGCPQNGSAFVTSQTSYAAELGCQFRDMRRNQATQRSVEMSVTRVRHHVGSAARMSVGAAARRTWRRTDG